MKNAPSSRVSTKRWLLAAIDGVLCALAAAAATLLMDMPTPVLTVVIAALAGTAALALLGVYRLVTSQMVMRDGTRFLGAAMLGGALLFAALLALTPVMEAARTAALFALLMFLLVTLVHFTGRLMLRQYARRGATRDRVVIYGAGQAGLQLAAALDNSADHEAVAFVDDNAELHGRMSHGLPIYPTAILPRLVSGSGVSQVLLAIPSAAAARRREILGLLENLPVKIASVPGMKDIASGRVRVNDLRHIEIEELLERNVVPPDQELLRRAIAGKSVMVTGAGGSIGSELCRQILRHGPRRLVLFEVSEAALYNIFEELNQPETRGATELLPIIASVLDATRLDLACRGFEVKVIYHAAAYKHVLLVEQNVTEGARNNIAGTRNVLDAAFACGAEALTLISTDKAVRPTSVMGATKRIAEIVTQAYARREMQGAPVLSIVRFGNVLGSSGSVVPKFRAQIARGGPVTVTHQDVVRYFMTIPEASQLVMQAGAMAKTGDLFVLDMGKPVRIYDLARRMIRLSGCVVRDGDNPGGDIAIEITGLKPGEKLFEELLLGEAVERTAHPGIWRAREPSLPEAEMEQIYRQLMTEIEAGRAREAIAILRHVVLGFHPSTEFVDLIGNAANAR